MTSRIAEYIMGSARWRFPALPGNPLSPGLGNSAELPYRGCSSKKRSLMLLLFIFIMIVTASGVRAQQLNIALPDTILKPGDQELLAVTVDELVAGDGVVSGEFTLDYDRSVITIDEVETTGTLLEGEDVMYNETTGRFAFAASDTVTGTGTLFYLSVRMEDDSGPGSETGLGMDAMFNEGEPDVAVSAGVIRSPQIVISPSRPTVIEGDDLQFDLDGDIHPPINWSVTNETVASIDDNGLLTGHEPGTIRVYAEDAIGLKDSTELFRVEPDLLRALTVSTPDTTVRQTREFWWTVEVTDVTGLNITSVQFDLAWADEHLEFLEVSTDSTLLETYGSGSFEFDYEDGKLSVAAAGTDPLEGGGAIAHIKLRVRDEASGNQTPVFSEMLFNEDLEPDLESGTISVNPAPEIYLAPDSIDIVAGETESMAVDEGGTPPYRWESDDPAVVTVDENTGEITAVSRGTTEVYAVDDEDFRSFPAEVTVYDVNVSLGDSTLIYPETLSIPVVTEDITGLGVFAFEMSVAIDTSLVAFEGVETSGKISDGMSVSSNVSDGVLMVAAAGTEELASGGELISLKFSAGDSARNHDVMPLQFERMVYNDPGDDSPTALPHDGSITIGGYPVVPDPVRPEDGAQQVAIQPELQWESEFGEFFDLQIAGDETFSSPVIDETGLDETSFVPGGDLEYEATYYWRVRSGTGSLLSEWSDTLSFQTQMSPPEVPVLALPADGEEGLEPPVTLNWFSVAEADSYRVQIALDENYADVVFEVDGVTDTTITADNLEDDEEYHWQVRAYRGTTPGDWSDSRSFTTPLLEPEVVEPVSPADGETGIEEPVVLVWNETDRAESYHIQLSDEPGLSAFLTDSSGVTDTLYSVEAELEPMETYYWRVRSERQGLVSDWSDVFEFETASETGSEAIGDLPDEVKLSQNYPNPFNPATTIRYGLPAETNVTLEVYNVVGQRVTVLVDERQPAGRHEVTFDASRLSSGMYIYRLHTEPRTITRQMMLVK